MPDIRVRACADAGAAGGGRARKVPAKASFDTGTPEAGCPAMAAVMGSAVCRAASFGVDAGALSVVAHSSSLFFS